MLADFVRRVLLLALVFVAVASEGRERVYFLAAEETNWDYFPEQARQVDIATLDNRQQRPIEAGKGRIGTRYRKVIYRGYTDETFSQVLPQPAWQGLLGPTLHVEVGDTLKVVFRNNAARPYSIYVRGLPTSRTSEAAPVPPGETRTYKWHVDESAAPGPNDPSSISWPYYSDSHALRDTHSGLVGALVVTRRGLAGKAGKPIDVDRELVMLAAVFDENQSWYLPDNLRRVDSASADRDAAFRASNRMPSINGMMHASLPQPRLVACERVRIHALSMNNGLPGISLTWHGNTLLHRGHRTDSLFAVAGTAVTADMLPRRPGTWVYGAARAELQYSGLWARYEVLPAPKPCK